MLTVRSGTTTPRIADPPLAGSTRSPATAPSRVVVTADAVLPIVAPSTFDASSATVNSNDAVMPVAIATPTSAVQRSAAPVCANVHPTGTDVGETLVASRCASRVSVTTESKPPDNPTFCTATLTVTVDPGVAALDMNVVATSRFGSTTLRPTTFEVTSNPPGSWTVAMFSSTVVGPMPMLPGMSATTPSTRIANELLPGSLSLVTVVAATCNMTVSIVPAVDVEKVWAPSSPEKSLANAPLDAAASTITVGVPVSRRPLGSESLTSNPLFAPSGRLTTSW